MEEPAGGANQGHHVSDNPALEGRHVSLATEAWQREEFMRSNGWTLVHNIERRAAETGARSHAVNQHTVLHPDEYVDEEIVACLVEDELGFTVEQLHSVYCTGGRIPSDRQVLRDALDARLLELSRGGANMDLFGRIAGLNGSTVDRALARARNAEAGQ